MERDEALRKLAEEWKSRGIVGAEPTLWDLALALARSHAQGDGDEAPAAEAEPLPKAE